jgi:hypothetical protein
MDLRMHGNSENKAISTACICLPRRKTLFCSDIAAAICSGFIIGGDDEDPLIAKLFPKRV